MESRSLTPNDIYLASFPFGDSAGMKLRPVLLLTEPVGSVPEILVAYISSVIPSDLLATDILLDPNSTEHASTTLKTLSVLRLHKLATIHSSSAVRRLGTVSPAVATDVQAKLRSLLRL
jgi:mRNA interferase MazF